MTDNEFWTIITTVLNDALDDFDMTYAPDDVELSRAYQPRQQGTDPNPIMVFNTIHSKRYGWQGNKDVWNETTEVFDHTECWTLERTIQVNAQVYEDPAADESTAFDLVDQMASLLNSVDVVKSLKLLGIGILPIKEVRAPFFQDDKDRFVMSPNFDFVVNYGQTKASTGKPLTEIQLEFQRV